MEEFREFQKIPRLSRECIITEKIDGTNASVFITEDGQFLTGSRTRWIQPEADNFGFSHWAHEHKDELLTLGPGHHFGEWWGHGIQRGYGLLKGERRFSLFNTGHWVDRHGPFLLDGPPEGYAFAPHCCHVVPVLAIGVFSSWLVVAALDRLRDGSLAAPGFKNPEGVVIFHTASNTLFKKTIFGDDEGKHAEAHPKKEKAPRPPKDPSKGGRRIEQIAFLWPERRKAASPVTPSHRLAWC